LAVQLSLAFQVYPVAGEPPMERSNHLPVVTKDLLARVESCRHCIPAKLARQVRKNQPFIYRCPIGLHHCAIPVASEKEMEELLVVGEAPPAACSLEEVEKFNTLGMAQTTVMGDSLEESKIPAAIRHVLDQLSPILAQASQFMKNAEEEKLRLTTSVTTLSTLLQMSKRIAEISSESEIEETLLHTLGVLYNIPLANLLKLNPTSALFTTTAAFGPAGHPLRLYACGSDQVLLSELLESGNHVYCDEMYRLLKAGYGEGTTTAHLFPIPERGKIKRVLQIFNCQFPPEEVAAIQAFCKQVAISLERLDLLEEVAGKNRDLTRLQELASSSGDTLELNELLRLVLAACMEVVGAEQGSLMLLEEDSMELLIKAVKGIDEKIIERFRLKPGEGVGGQVFVNGIPVLVTNIETDERFHHVNRPRYRTPSFMSIPIRFRNRSLGVINVADKKGADHFTIEDVQMLCSYAAQASVAIERSIYYEKSKALRQISITDSLTSLLNRRYFQERLTEEIDRAKRHHHKLSLIMLDLDNFKEFNDTHGHLAGDQALRVTAQIVRNNVRAIDVVARFGGEEFSVILPETAKEEATILAHRIRREIEKGFLLKGITRLHKPLTMSLGLATFPEDAQSLTSLIHNADRALYTAKAFGKNRVVVFQEDPPTNSIS
ncbi:MAG TPA: sensor domain-containing diguanylate cyclase, partial [bacterium]|nr:sensor domain-containing diguanylate cyclase [bacterium]